MLALRVEPLFSLSALILGAGPGCLVLQCRGAGGKVLVVVPGVTRLEQVGNLQQKLFKVVFVVKTL